jgi:hypothetical protein
MRLPVVVEVCCRQPSRWAAALSALDVLGLLGVGEVVWVGSVLEEVEVGEGECGLLRWLARASPRGRAIVRTMVTHAARVMRCCLTVGEGLSGEVMVGSWWGVVVVAGWLMALVYACIHGRSSPRDPSTGGEISRREIRLTRGGC